MMEATSRHAGSVGNRCSGLGLSPAAARSAFLGCHRKEGGQLLLDLFASAFWTLHMRFVVFGNRQSQRKFLFAIETFVIIHGHGS